MTTAEEAAAALCKLVRPSGMVHIINGMRLVPNHKVVVTFPADYVREELRGVSVMAIVFAAREGPLPLWLEWRHPEDGGWRTGFAAREWCSEPPERSAFKRPVRLAL